MSPLQNEVNIGTKEDYITEEEKLINLTMIRVKNGVKSGSNCVKRGLKHDVEIVQDRETAI